MFACASTSSDRMLKKCEEVKVKFVPKPIFETKLRYILKPFLPWTKTIISCSVIKDKYIITHIFMNFKLIT